MNLKSLLAGLMLSSLFAGFGLLPQTAFATALGASATGFTVVSPYTTKSATCEAEYFRKRSGGLTIEYHRSGPLEGDARTFKEDFRGFSLQIALDRNCEDEDRQCWDVDLVSRVSKGDAAAEAEQPLQGQGPWSLKTRLVAGLEEVLLSCRAENR